MQSIFFFLSATLCLLSQKETPSVRAPRPATAASTLAFETAKQNDCVASLLNKTATNADENERPIILKSFNEISVAAPMDAKAYQLDVSETKKKNAKRTETQQMNAQHWQRNPILKWNEFACQLVAAHNVPPRVLPDSSGYPVPNRSRAADNPRYPFANPPYAARVFAYLSVAQHDALLTAQFYQAKFQQMSNAVPSERQYPSTEMAVAAASAEVLKYLFPASIKEIDEKLENARQSALFTEKYAENDLEVAEKLGIAVAKKVVSRAETDGMETAQGSATQWQQVFNRHTEGGEIAWISKLKPIRPSIEPFFGNVRAWWVTDIAKMRPAAPPATTSDALKKELEIVKNTTRGVTKERMDIIVRWTDAEFTPTPVGHWNIIACDLLQKNKSSDLEIVRTLALLNRGLMDATIVCWEAKTFYCYPRPSQLDPSVNPRLPLPNFPSYPSGHSVFSSAAATILGNSFPIQADSLNKMAEEASISRLYAGVHFKMDCDAGVILGKKIGAMSVEKAKK